MRGLLIEFGNPTHSGSVCSAFSKGHLVDKAKRSMLLNLESLKYEPWQPEPRVFYDLEQTQLGSIELLLHLFQGQNYRVTTSRFGGSTDTNTGMCTSQLYIECGGSRVFDRHPPLAKWLLDKR